MKKKPKNTNTLPLVLCIIAVSLWIVAAILPAYTSPDKVVGVSGSFVITGLDAFFRGMISPFSFQFIATLIWSANFIALAAIADISRTRDSTGAVLGLVALLLSLGALSINQMPVEIGPAGSITLNPQIGVYVWIASIALIFLATLVAKPKAGIVSISK